MPPFRAEPVGSFLRPKFLLDAREQFFVKKEIDAEQPRVREALLDDRLQDRGDDPELAAAVRAVLQLEIKAKLQRRLTCTQVRSQLKTR